MQKTQMLVVGLFERVNITNRGMVKQNMETQEELKWNNGVYWSRRLPDLLFGEEKAITEHSIWHDSSYLNFFNCKKVATITFYLYSSITGNIVQWTYFTFAISQQLKWERNWSLQEQCFTIVMCYEFSGGTKLGMGWTFCCVLCLPAEVDRDAWKSAYGLRKIPLKSRLT